jgi:hypothetical protein
VSAPDYIASLAAAMLRIRRVRAQFLPAELLSEPVWDVLLELFVADAEGKRLTGREISERANIPPSVMGRWLIHLTSIGLIIGDGIGELDDTLTLSGFAMAQVEEIMNRAQRLLVSPD